MKLYSTLAEWWPLLSSPDDYAKEADHYWNVLCKHARRPIRTMLELGCGGGNNAVHLKRKCKLTLTDLSAEMLGVSCKLNPECEHVQGDMRSLRLARQFDAVFVHDAVMYLCAEDHLRQAVETAFAHCAPGGAALFVPDCTTETWTPSTDHGGHDGADGRSLRYLERCWDPDPADAHFTVDFAYLLYDRDGAIRVEQDRHRLGLFSRSTWVRLLRETGFQAAREPAVNELQVGEMFVGVRPR